MIFETHAHYEDEQYIEDRKELLDSLSLAGVDYVVNVASSMNTSEQCMSLSRQYDFIYASVGVHPDNVNELDETKLKQLGKW